MYTKSEIAHLLSLEVFPARPVILGQTHLMNVFLLNSTSPFIPLTTLYTALYDVFAFRFIILN